MSDLFDLSVFVDKGMKVNSLTEDNVQSHQRTIEVFNVFVQNDIATDQILSSFTLTELEWVYDLISYWPSMEIELVPEDLDHYGVQREQICHLVQSFSELKSQKRREVFI
ncbi:hypothetical protein [Bacillus subtilis]|uniref:Uncharacterized protein n=1 Tax=Bacillus subtilis TaxID=1423 RepID=A0A8I2B8V6_BACIU|nr:hypothetical protein [Bacillus subtilis]KAF2421618.1 hypothetical protein B6K89_20700 [Bacillus subtilis]MBO3794190.1 hypothetical protein [Bacillus subtilis]